jgi:polyisoprenyl-phosphate glycosyltransferase
MKLSIVVPCYNEAENIPSLLSAYAEVITQNDIEIILVNNGSTDTTGTLLEELTPQYSNFLHVVTVPINKGYGFGILAGLKAATGEFVGWTHGDLQTPPADVIRSLAILEKNGLSERLYVKGNRQGRPLFDRFFTYGMSLFESCYFGAKMHDINAQPNIFHRSFFDTWQNPPHDFALDLFVFYTALKADLEIIRFPVQFPKRQHGTSKWNTGLAAKLKFIKRTIGFSRSLKQSLDIT